MSAALFTPRIGPYRLVRRIGIGGTAEVFEAIFDGPEGPAALSPGQRVAVKRALPMISEEPELSALFVDEARLALRLRHPAIVRAYDWGVHPLEEGSAGDPFLVMELVSGHPLRKLLRVVSEREEGAPPAAVAAVGIEVAEALACIHGLRGEDGRPLEVIHRDVSPHNLVLQPDGVLKLIDFGVAKYSGSARTRTGVVKGKHAYMSPEQAERRPIDQRSDLFALGVSLWELAAGRRLFHGGSVPETVDLVCEARVPPLTEVAPGVPADLADLVMRCLARDPGGRPASAAAVVGELRAWLEANDARRPRDVLAALYAGCFADEASPSAAADDIAPAAPPHRWGRAAVAWTVGLLSLAFVAATALWYVERVSG